MAGRILYLQYTNPAALPPLEHSSRILASRGWQVLFIGTEARNATPLRFPPHPHIAVRQMPFQNPGWRQKLHYLRFCAWALSQAIRWRPHWVYVSDALACPAALLIHRLSGIRMMYHEHDSPDHTSSVSVFQRLVLQSRQQVARCAVVCILPNQQRLECFVASIKVDPQRTICVWNCPRQDEVRPARNKKLVLPLTLYYHGSIGSHRLPMTLLDAMAKFPAAVKRLDVVGYETIGTEGYLKQFRQYATKLELDRLLHIHPPQLRHKLWGMMGSSSTGLAMVTGSDINLRMMVGASNKAFDYLAAGLSLIVPDTPDWQAMFVKPGYGLACNPDDTASLVNAFSWLAEHPVETYEMGELGRQRILEDWNYERQFAPVLDYLCRS